jgi:hypothetical protein
MHSGFSSLSCDCCWFDFKTGLFYFCIICWRYAYFFYSCYKDYLSVDFPFESYKQVFIEPEMAVSSLSLGASMSIFSSQALFDEKVIDQVGHSLTSYCWWVYYKLLLNFFSYASVPNYGAIMHVCWMYDVCMQVCLFESNMGPLL